MRQIAAMLTVALLPLMAAAQAPKASFTSVHVICPYNIQGIWAFDDTAKGLDPRGHRRSGPCCRRVRGAPRRTGCPRQERERKR